MAVITSLRPNLSRAEAIAAFSEGWAGRLGGGGLRSVAEAFVPFRLYEVVVQNGSRPQKSWFALDAGARLLHPLPFEGPPAPAGLPCAVACRTWTWMAWRVIFTTGDWTLAKAFWSRVSSSLVRLGLTVRNRARSLCSMARA